MKDETFVFIQDVKEKGNTARSARNARTHCGKGGRVKFPSDYMTKKEIQKMNGEVKSYRLNEPMTWGEFMAMPDDIKIVYIKMLRHKFNVPGKYIAEMMGTNPAYYSKEIGRLGISEGKNCRGRYTPWDREGFVAWCNGSPVTAADPVEEVTENVEQPVNETPEDGRQMASLEDIAEPVPAPVLEIKTLPVHEEKPKAIPISGNMIFEGKIEDVLNSVSVLLGGAYVNISVTWEVVPAPCVGECRG